MQEQYTKISELSNCVETYINNKCHEKLEAIKEAGFSLEDLRDAIKLYDKIKSLSNELGKVMGE